MGKNRKLRNGVDQVQNFCNLETDNHNKKPSGDFLLSDDFCVVPNQKECKKISECEDSGASVQSLSELGKSVVGEDIEKVNNIKRVNSVESSFLWKSQSLCETVGGTSDNSEFRLNNFLSLKTAETESDLEISVSDENKDINPESQDLVTHDNGISNIESSSNENVVVENSRGTKKKNKRKMHKKNSVELEVERLIKELELDDKVVVGPKINTVIIASCDKSSQHLKSGDTAKDVNIDAYNEKLSEANFLLTGSYSELKNNVDLRDSSNETENRDCDSKSLKRKEKRLKAKQKATESENSNSNLPEVNCIDTSSSQDVASVESACSSIKEEISVPKPVSESERKGKRPNKKQLALIHEALKKAKEEEEKQRKEAEMKQKMAEEAERIRQEKLRQEVEKKEKRKIKDKQRREKMKAEGRLLSKSQKQSRARMEATLAALRQQGVEVPHINERKPSISSGSKSGNCKNFHRKRNNSSQSIHSNDSAIVLSERHKSESLSSQESQESGKESLSDLPSNFDSTDDSPLNPESKCSCSDESDGLDDGICRDLYKSKKTTDTKTLDKSKQNKTEIISLNQIKPAESPRSENYVKYRSPVVCVLGHVDTGKTKLLDYIRKTHVQDCEAGGITQQIGATMIPRDALKEKCKMVKDFSSFNVDVPGLLVIDTPGHESFSNLRSRGSSICDIAILVVDIMHGLEPQTIESINLLKKGKIPFVVALNKIDRIYDWKSNKDEDIESSIKNQSHVTQSQFQKRCQEIVLQFANECLNVVLFYENKDPRSYISMVPTSAITGDGMGNLLGTVTHLSQTLMRKKLVYSENLEATVLEVKAIPGLGTTIDVILVNGRLKEGDTIVIAGQEGPIVTQIRSLLMPQSLKELRVKNPYTEYKTVEGAQGVKLTGRDLEKSIAGLPLLVASNQTMIDVCKHEMNDLLRDVMNSIRTSERGVYVQASTLGSLEALLDFLSASGVPYFHAKIGPVVKKDVMKASIMLEHDSIYAAILAFDVKIERDAQELADNLGVRIFHADIIYHLLDMYVQYRDDVLFKRNEEIKTFAVFPCKLKILPEFVFSLRDPVILGVCVEQGILKEGTPLCVPSRSILEVGIVSSIEMNNNKIDCAKKGDEVCITIDPKPGETSKVYGKHFDHEDVLVSHISRQSIDVVKQHFRSELHSSDWHLMIELKKMLHVM